MTQSHIQFTPLILPRKTPAEEMKEIIARLPFNTLTGDMKRLQEFAEHCKAPDEPKRWDGAFPWVSEFGPNYANVHFSPVLRWHLMSNGTCIYTGEAREGDKPSNKSPYHDGVIITITAGSGDEDVRVVRWNDADKGGINKSLYLRLYRDCGVKLTDCGGRACVGDVVESLHDDQMVPLPQGTVTRITINNTLPTTEQRYSVEVVEAEKPKFATVDVDDGRILVGVNHDRVTTDYLASIVGHVIEPRIARQFGAALTAAANHLDPQEQPATVAVGLPLEFACDCDSDETMTLLPPDRFNRLAFYFDSGSVYLSPADEARLRNLLNQRHADGKGGAS